MGGKSSSSSQANQSTTTNYSDSRVTNRDGVVAGAGAVLDLSTFTDASMRFDDSSNRSTNTWDSSNRSVTTINNSLDSDITGQAFDFAKGVDATQGRTMENVLSFADRLTARTNDSATTLAGRFQDNVLQAFDSARTTTPGGIDNKTMIVLGVAAAAVVGAVAMSKRG